MNSALSLELQIIMGLMIVLLSAILGYGLAWLALMAPAKKKPQRTKHTNRKKVLLPVMMLAIMLVSIASPMFQGVTFAAAPAQCATTNDSDLNNWDWISWASKTSPRSGTITGGGIPFFYNSPPYGTSYLMLGSNYTLPGSAGQATNVLYTTSNANSKLIMYMSGGVEGIKTSDGGPIYVDYVDGRLAGVSYSFDRRVMASGSDIAGGVLANVQANANTAIGGTVACANGAFNVVYDSSWTDPKITYAQGYTSGTATASGSNNCANVLDISCQVTNLYNGVTNDILHVFQAFTAGLYSLFVPDNNALTQDATNLKSFAIVKLGFLTFPFTFMNDIFNAFMSAGSSGHTVGCGSATFLGGHFCLDLEQWATTAPTFWSWFTGIVQAVTVLSLMFFLYRKFVEVTQT